MLSGAAGRGDLARSRAMDHRQPAGVRRCNRSALCRRRNDHRCGGDALSRLPADDRRTREGDDCARNRPRHPDHARRGIAFIDAAGSNRTLLQIGVAAERNRWTRRPSAGDDSSDRTRFMPPRPFDRRRTFVRSGAARLRSWRRANLNFVGSPGAIRDVRRHGPKRQLRRAIGQAARSNLRAVRMQG